MAGSLAPSGADLNLDAVIFKLVRRDRLARGKWRQVVQDVLRGFFVTLSGRSLDVLDDWNEARVDDGARLAAATLPIGSLASDADLEEVQVVRVVCAGIEKQRGPPFDVPKL